MDKVLDAQVVQVVDIPFVTQRLFPVVVVTMEIPQLLVDKGVDAPIMCRSQHIETSCVDKVVHMTVVCNDRSLTSLSWRRGCFLYADHSDSPVAVH